MDDTNRSEKQRKVFNAWSVAMSVGICAVLERPVFSFFNPADTAALVSIASSTAATLSVLKTTTELLELSDDTRKMLGGTRDDAEALQEFFQEISPEPGTREYDDSIQELKENQSLLNQIDDNILEADSVKWDAKYLNDQAKNRPKRIGNLARMGTQIVRLGKKVGRLFNRSAQDRTAYNTENMVYQGYVNAQVLSDIRSMMREQRDREARERLKSVINTVTAIYAVMPDFDGQIEDRGIRRSFSATKSYNEESNLVRYSKENL